LGTLRNLPKRFETFFLALFTLDRKYFHAVWHVFVLAGSVFHYFAILFFLVLKK